MGFGLAIGAPGGGRFCCRGGCSQGQASLSGSREQTIASCQRVPLKMGCPARPPAMNRLQHEPHEHSATILYCQRARACVRPVFWKLRPHRPAHGAAVWRLDRPHAAVQAAGAHAVGDRLRCGSRCMQGSQHWHSHACHGCRRKKGRQQGPPQRGGRAAAGALHACVPTRLPTTRPRVTCCRSWRGLPPTQWATSSMPSQCWPMAGT